jgi:hypothetical protein
VNQQDSLGYITAFMVLDQFVNERSGIGIWRIEEHPTAPGLFRAIVILGVVPFCLDGLLGLDAACRVQIDNAAEQVSHQLDIFRGRVPFVGMVVGFWLIFSRCRVGSQVRQEYETELCKSPLELLNIRPKEKDAQIMLVVLHLAGG